MYHCNEIRNLAFGHDVILNKIELNNISASKHLMSVSFAMTQWHYRSIRPIDNHLNHNELIRLLLAR